MIIFNDKEMGRTTFDEKIELYKSDIFVNNITNLLNNINKDYKYYTPFYVLESKDIRIILTGYLIYYHRDIVFSENQDLLSDKLYDLVGKLIYSLNILINKENNIEIFNRYYLDLTNYFKLFIHWKKRESIVLSRPLIINYHYYTKHIEMGDERYIKAQHILKKNLYLLLGVEETNKILEDKTIPVDPQEPIINQTKNIMKKAFWDIFYEKLNNFEYDCIVVLLTEIIDNLKLIESELCDNTNDLDIEIIKQMLDVSSEGKLLLDKIQIFEISKIILLALSTTLSKKDKLKIDTVINNLKEKIDLNTSNDYILVTFKTIYSILETVRIIN